MATTDTTTCTCDPGLEGQPHLYSCPAARPIVATRNGALVPASLLGRPRVRWYCTTDREGNIVHVNACRDIVCGPSRLVHVGGRLECTVVA